MMTFSDILFPQKMILDILRFWGLLLKRSESYFSFDASEKKQIRGKVLMILKMKMNQYEITQKREHIKELIFRLIPETTEIENYEYAQILKDIGDELDEIDLHPVVELTTAYLIQTLELLSSGKYIKDQLDIIYHDIISAGKDKLIELNDTEVPERLKSGFELYVDIIGKLQEIFLREDYEFEKLGVLYTKMKECHYLREYEKVLSEEEE